MNTLLHNLKAGATSQYTAGEFNSFCRFNGALLAAGPAGFSKYGAAVCAATGNPDASFKTFDTRFGYTGQDNRVRYLTLAITLYGDLQIDIYVDGVLDHTLDVAADMTGRQFVKVPGGRGARGEYWSFKVRNVDGAWFSIEEMHALPIFYGRFESMIDT